MAGGLGRLTGWCSRANLTPAGSVCARSTGKARSTSRSRLQLIAFYNLRGNADEGGRASQPLGQHINAPRPHAVRAQALRSLGQCNTRASILHASVQAGSGGGRCMLSSLPGALCRAHCQHACPAQHGVPVHGSGAPGRRARLPPSGPCPQGCGRRSAVSGAAMAPPFLGRRMVAEMNSPTHPPPRSPQTSSHTSTRHCHRPTCLHAPLPRNCKGPPPSCRPAQCRACRAGLAAHPPAATAPLALRSHPTEPLGLALWHLHPSGMAFVGIGSI